MNNRWHVPTKTVVLNSLAWACMTCAVVQTHAGAARIVAEPSTVRAFLGNQGGIALFVDKQDDNRLKWVDFNARTPAITPLSDQTNCTNPRLSPDGTRVVYTSGETVYACSLSDGAAAAIGNRGENRSGGVAYWHEENGLERIMYCTSTPKGGYDQGTTYFQPIHNGIEPDGSALPILDKSYDAGISSDGVWIGETYGGRHAYNRETGREYATFYRADGSAEGQCCNGSMAPDGTHRFLMLVLPHDYIRLYSYDASRDRWAETATFVKPAESAEWQTPEYSTHGDYFSATGKKSNGAYDLYLIRISDDARLRLVEGDIGNSHLYIGATGASGPRIALSDNDLSFSAVTGGSAPEPQSIRILNSGDGELGECTAGEDAQWLTVAISGSGNDQTIQNQITLEGLAPGAYQTSVRVSAGDSPSATYTVSLTYASSPGPGSGILREQWNGIDGAAISDLTDAPAYPYSPDFRDVRTQFAGPLDTLDSYGARYRGYLIAPQTGEYRFWIAADDNAALYLSASVDPGDAALIAAVNEWTAARQWDKETSQRSAAVPLEEGERYYIEALHKEESGGDHISVRCMLPDGSFEAPIPGHRLDPYDPALDIAVLGGPHGGQRFVAGESLTVTWSTRDSSLFNDCVIELSPDNGRNWIALNGQNSIGLDANAWGRYDWPIPHSGISAEGYSLISEQCLVRIHQYGNESIYGISDAPFAVAPAASAAGAPTAMRRSVRTVRIGRRVMRTGIARTVQGRLELVSPHGRRVYAASLRHGADAEIPAAGLGQGLYLVRVFSRDATLWRRMVMIP
jgi:hypothetical protein